MHNNSTTVDISNEKMISIHKTRLTPQFTTNSVYRNINNSPKHFLELSLFKQQLKNKPYKLHHYEAYAQKVNVYRLIFFSLAILFLGLSAIIFHQNISFSPMIFGDLRILIRNAICIFTVCIGFIAASIGYSFCIVKEATECLTRKARGKLSRLYLKKQIELGISGKLWPRGNNKAQLLKLARVECQEKINHRKAETAELLREIRNSSGFDIARHELLFSQALAEMEEHNKSDLRSFKEFQF